MAKARSSSLRRRASTGSFMSRSTELPSADGTVRGKPPRKTSAGFLAHMAEGRKCQVMLQDDRRLHFLIQPKLLTLDLLDMVASHFTLKEKEFFGLAFQDESGHFNWLQTDRRVLEHDYPKKTGPLLLHFQVKFFIESIAYLRDNATIEVFYLQAKQSIYKGTVEADSDTIYELAAHVLQESHGNYDDDESTRNDLRKLPVLPIRTLKEHPSLSYCEEEIITHYKKLSGLSRGSAIVNYMTIVESLPTYGIHSYEVKDKTGLPWWIGLSYKGIAQYDYSDKKVPRRVFPWKQLENLYFRDKKFSIEVLDPKRIVHTLSTYNLYEEAIQEPIEYYDQLTDDISDPTTQVSVSRRTFGPSNVNVFAWFTTTPQLTKCIWSMAVSQHQFYLDRKQSKSHIPAVRSMSEIAADLSQSTPSLHGSAVGSDNLSQCSSTASLQQHGHNTGTLPRHSDVSQEDIEEIRAAQKEMYQALKARKEALEAALKKKTEELKNICLKESELTGELPKETPLVPGEPLPQVRRRMGTAFSLSPKMVDREHRSQDEEYVSKLELEYELQKQICHAAQKLSQDGRLNKKARKQRKTQYINAHLKLKNLERKLKEAIDHARRFRTQSQDETEFTPAHSPALKRRGPENESKSSLESSEPSRPSTLLRDGTVPSTNSSQCSLPEFSSPHSPHKHLSRESSPSPNRPTPVGYMPSSVYTTRTQYRNSTYPTFSIRSHSLSSTHSDYDSTGSVNHGSRSDVNQSRSDVSTSRSDVARSDSRQDVSYEQRLAEVAQTYYGGGQQPQQIHHHQQQGPTSNHSNRSHSSNGEETRAPIINPYVTVETNQDYRYRPDEDRLQNMCHTGSLDKIYRRRRNSGGESRAPSDDRRYGSLERNFTYARSNPSEYVGQYEITHIEEGEVDNQDYYQTPVPENIQDSAQSPTRQVHAAGDGHRPRFYIDEQEPVTVQGESFTTVTQYPHFREESKPFEMRDFYQYSEKLRRQRLEKRGQDGRSSPTPSHSSSTSGDRTCVPHYAHSIRVGGLSPGMDYAYPVQGSPSMNRSPYDSPQSVRSRPTRHESVDDERPRTPLEQLLGQAAGGLSPSPYSSPRITPRAISPRGTPKSRDTSFNLDPPNLASTFSKEMFEWYHQDQEKPDVVSSSLV